MKRYSTFLVILFSAMLSFGYNMQIHSHQEGENSLCVDVFDNDSIKFINDSIYFLGSSYNAFKIEDVDSLTFSKGSGSTITADSVGNNGGISW